MEQRLLIDIIKSHYHTRILFTSNKEVCPFEEKTVKKSSIQTRLHYVHDQLILKGYARELKYVVATGKCWYLLYHRVYHLNRPGKICMVFDLSVEFHGISVNKALLSGPDLTKQIAGELLRFKEEQIEDIIK